MDVVGLGMYSKVDLCHTNHQGAKKERLVYIISLTHIIQHLVFATAKFLLSFSVSDIVHGPRGGGTFYCHNYYKITKINEVFVIINNILVLLSHYCYN